ncbi:hypothetical protein PssB301D_02666 [Pseudomonas syringae pv. syringae str. B301D-R]|nr:hypothetical protein PssB301D_02666 [Pseudomonas syringae pv. syringae str. B301D-R]
MTAQFEEMVMPADLFQLEQVLPDPCNGHLGVAFGRFIATTGHRRAVRRRQSLAVELAIGGQREAFQTDKGARQHVLGQRQAQLFAQSGGIQFDVRGTDDIRHQTFVAWFVLTHQHQGILYTVTRAELCFYFAQLDAEAANLDLFVVPSQVLKAAIGQPAAQVTGAVQARTRRRVERVIDETLGRQCFTVQVATCHTGTADVQLADHADRHRLAMGVEHIQLQIGNAPADRAGTDTLCIVGLQRVIGHMHRGFGDAVHVYQLRAGIHVAGIPRLEHRRFQRFSTENHLAQRMRLLVLALCGNQLAERTRCLVEHRDPGTAQQVVEVLR